MTTSDLSIAKQLVNTYSIILKTDSVLNDVVENLPEESKVSARKIAANLSAAAVNNTEIFRISYVDTDPVRAKEVVNAIADIAPEKIIEVVKAGDASVIEKQAATPSSPISPHKLRNTAIAALAVFLASSLVFVLVSLLDTRVRSVEDLSEMFGYPVLGSVPTITADLDSAEKAEGEDE